MPHQSRFLESVREGHRTFLLADEPGLGKTAESVLAASVADAYPLLAVVPNVVKMNWAREVERWTPQRRATVIHGDGEDVDAFADVFIVNYEILDRHLSWLSSLGLKGMVVDEAHFIKNLGSQRSQNVLALAARIREQVRNPLLLALTGTPLINDVEDFDAIWRFLGWTTGEKPGPVLMERLDETGLTPADKAFYPEARDAVISMGIVRRKKKDVAADLPDKLIADLPVELDDEFGRSIRQAERELGARLADRYRRIIDARGDRGLAPGEVDPDIVRLVAQNELDESKAAGTGSENVFTMVRKIGQAKALLAADYAVQLQRSVGKVVFFAKHIDVMDAAEAHFAAAGLRTISMRGDQTTPVRQQAIDAFNNDPERRHRGLLADRGRRRREHAGGVQRRARRAVVDGRRADAGDRPRAPHRPGRAGHGVAHHRRAHDRHEDRRAHRLEAGARASARSTAKRSTRSPAIRCSSRRSCTWSGRRSERTEDDQLGPCGRRRARDGKVGGGSVARSNTRQQGPQHEDRHPHQRRRLPRTERGHPRRRAQGHDDLRPRVRRHPRRMARRGGRRLLPAHAARGEGPVEGRRHDPRHEPHEPLRGPARRRGEHREDALRPPHRRHHRDRRRGHPRRGGSALERRHQRPRASRRRSTTTCARPTTRSASTPP